MPEITVMIPNVWSLWTFSFKNITAIIIVTTDKADAMGVIKIASPIVNPKLTIAIAPASIIPIDISINFVFIEDFVKEISCFTRNEKSRKSKIIPNFINKVAWNHPIFSDINSLIFQKEPKKKAPITVSLTPVEIWKFLLFNITPIQRCDNRSRNNHEDANSLKGWKPLIHKDKSNEHCEHRP